MPTSSVCLVHAWDVHMRRRELTLPNSRLSYILYQRLSAKTAADPPRDTKPLMMSRPWRQQRVLNQHDGTQEGWVLRDAFSPKQQVCPTTLLSTEVSTCFPPSPRYCPIPWLVIFYQIRPNCDMPFSGSINCTVV